MIAIGQVYIWTDLENGQYTEFEIDDKRSDDSWFIKVKFSNFSARDSIFSGPNWLHENSILNNEDIRNKFELKQSEKTYKNRFALIE